MGQFNRIRKDITALIHAAQYLRRHGVFPSTAVVGLFAGKHDLAAWAQKHRIILPLLDIYEETMEWERRMFDDAGREELLAFVSERYPLELYAEFLYSRHTITDAAIIKMIFTRPEHERRLTVRDPHRALPVELLYTLRNYRIKEMTGMRRPDIYQRELGLMERFYYRLLMQCRFRLTKGAWREHQYRYNVSCGSFNTLYAQVFPAACLDRVRTVLTSEGKLIYYAPGSRYVIVRDIAGGYFRISDSNIRKIKGGMFVDRFARRGGKRRYRGPYLDVNLQRVPYYGPEGRPFDFMAYERLTHIQNTDFPGALVQGLVQHKDEAIHLYKLMKLLRQCCGIRTADVRIKDTAPFALLTQGRGRERWYVSFTITDNKATLWVSRTMFAFLEQYTVLYQERFPPDMSVLGAA